MFPGNNQVDQLLPAGREERPAVTHRLSPKVAADLAARRLADIIRYMRIEQFQNLLRRRPFEPFAIYTSDGSTYSVTHPDQIIITPRAAYVGLGNDPEGLVAQDVVICDLIHVTRLGPLDGAKRKRRRTKPE